jgi:hypothetical protein
MPVASQVNMTRLFSSVFYLSLILFLCPVAEATRSGTAKAGRSKSSAVRAGAKNSSHKLPGSPKASPATASLLQSVLDNATLPGDGPDQGYLERLRWGTKDNGGVQVRHGKPGSRLQVG